MKTLRAALIGLLVGVSMTTLTAFVSIFDSGGGGSGTVTSIATTSPISGGTITTTGTISLLVNVDHAFTAAQSITRANIGAVTTDGLLVQNTTAAAAGAQQWSPRVHWLGSGWKTNATAAAQQVEWYAEIEPTQSAAAPTNALIFKPVRNGVTPGTGISFCQADTGTPSIVLIGLDGTSSLDCTAGVAFAGFGHVGIANQFAAYNNGGESFRFAPSMVTAKLTFSITGAAPTAVANVGANSCGTTAATIAGTNNAGEVTVGATSGTQCRIQFSVAAPTRWDCVASDESTAQLVRGKNVDTTHADLLGTFTAGDVLAYVCIPR